MCFQHFIYFYNPPVSHLPLCGILEVKTDTCQDMRSRQNQNDPLQSWSGRELFSAPTEIKEPAGSVVAGLGNPQVQETGKVSVMSPAHAPADAQHMTSGQLVAAKPWPAHPLP